MKINNVLYQFSIKIIDVSVPLIKVISKLSSVEFIYMIFSVLLLIIMFRKIVQITEATQEQELSFCYSFIM